MADAAEGPKCHGSRDEAFDASSGSIGLRVGAIFIILASSLFTTMFPIVTHRVPRLSVPGAVFDFAKYFGSGVIIATAFMHLLEPGADELGSECLNETFQSYPFAFAFAMISMFMTFLVELLAFRLGSGIASRLAYDPHKGGHHHANEHAHTSPAIAAHRQSEGLVSHGSDEEVGKSADSDSDAKSDTTLSAAASEILGVAILEFGVIFHSVIIGITLGTTNDFKILFIVIIFHQMFEGLGLGARLSLLPLQRTSWIPYIGAIAYSLVTPIGLAIGLGIRTTYNEDSATANYVTGTFDSVSGGILLYTGLVELLAHEFIFNDKMRTAPLGKVLLAVAEMFLGAALMALLAKWA
ncbi:unnamed protein product [Sympodiomycopsis kandeliae]